MSLPMITKLAFIQKKRKVKHLYVLSYGNKFRESAQGELKSPPREGLVKSG